MLRRTLVAAAVCTVLLLPNRGTPAEGHAPAAPLRTVDAKIEVVFPHDARGNVQRVSEAQLANVEVYLFQRNSLKPVSCETSNRVLLRWARNPVLPTGYSEQTPAHDQIGYPASAEGMMITRTVGAKVFPTWVFNDVPIEYPTPGADPALSKTFFYVDVEGADTRSNVWSHGADPRTFFPAQFNPKAVATAPSDDVDALIQVVYPHDQYGLVQPVDKAPLANVAVELVVHPMGASVPLSFNRPVNLLRALNDGYLQPVQKGQVTQRAVGALKVPRWEFNDVDTAESRDPGNKYFFSVDVGSVDTHPIIWAHGAEARTIFPQVDVPEASGAACR